MSLCTFRTLWRKLWQTPWNGASATVGPLVALSLLLAGCGGGCFGLCSAADDDDDDEIATVPVDPSSDLSCYTSSGTVARAENIPYSQAADASAEQVLRYFDSGLASSTAIRPLLVWITGDTWESGTSTTDAPTLARDLAEQLGANFAVVSYRQSDTAAWPAQIVDVKTAIRFMKSENVEQNFNIDLERIYVGGDQAGATLAALTAYTGGFDDFEPTEFPNQTDEPDLLFTFGGVYNFDSVLDDNAALPAACAGIAPNIDDLAIRRLFDCTVSDDTTNPLSQCDVDTLQLASPIQQVGPGSPPALFYHGTLDCQIPPAQSEELNDRYGSGGPDSILRGNGIFVALPNDDQTLASLSGTLILEDLIGFADFDCDDNT